ncbi:hypothetical protein [Spirosoma flavus]
MVISDKNTTLCPVETQVVNEVKNERAALVAELIEKEENLREVFKRGTSSALTVRL